MTLFHIPERKGFEPLCALAQTDFEKFAPRLSPSLSVPNLAGSWPKRDGFCACFRKNDRKVIDGRRRSSLLSVRKKQGNRRNRGKHRTLRVNLSAGKTGSAAFFSQQFPRLPRKVERDICDLPVLPIAAPREPDGVGGVILGDKSFAGPLRT